MTNHNHDNTRDQYINQKTRRSMEDWDKIEQDKETATTQNKHKPNMKQNKKRN